MAVVYSKVLLFDPPLIYTAPDTCVFGAVILAKSFVSVGKFLLAMMSYMTTHSVTSLDHDAILGHFGACPKSDKSMIGAG